MDALLHKPANGNLPGSIADAAFQDFSLTKTGKPVDVHVSVNTSGATELIAQLATGEKQLQDLHDWIRSADRFKGASVTVNMQGRDGSTAYVTAGVKDFKSFTEPKRNDYFIGLGIPRNENSRRVMEAALELDYVPEDRHPTGFLRFYFFRKNNR